MRNTAQKKDTTTHGYKIFRERKLALKKLARIPTVKTKRVFPTRIA